MKITADVRINPVQHVERGAPMVAGHMDEFHRAGLETHAHAMGINVSGEAETFFDTLWKVIGEFHEDGTDRVFTTVVIESRASTPPSIKEKIESIHNHRAS
jgi:uncharacterized protein YqgV (UPF0045/DUF77 family)